MYKLLLVIFLPALILFQGSDNYVQKLKKSDSHELPSISFPELTPEQKEEAIEYFKSTGECEWKGIKLYGKVKFVSSFPDIKIKYVESFPDIKVKFVNSFPDDCGEWQVVESCPDFKVQIVESFPDIK